MSPFPYTFPITFDTRNTGYFIEVDWENDGDFDDTYDDISSDVKAIHFSRGKSGELGRAEVGQCSITLKNDTNKYSPSNSGSVLYGKLLPKRPIRILYTDDIVFYPLFYGYLEEIIPHPHLTEQDCVITAMDGLDFLSRHDLATTVYKNDLTGTIHGYILTDAGWSATMRTLDAGQDTVPYWYGADVKASFAQEEIDNSEQGFSYINGAGNFCFEDRLHRTTGAHLVSQGTFDNTMANMTYSLSARNVYNIIKVTSTPRTLQSIAELWRLKETPSILTGATNTYWGESAYLVDEWTTPIALDIGNAATVRAINTASPATIIDLTNPANVNGIITDIEIWADTNITGLRVGTFYFVSGTDYKCRDSEVIGAVTAGWHTYSVTITVQTGDFIGFYTDAGGLEADDVGGSGVMYFAGEAIDPGDQATYTLGADDAISLYGYTIDYSANSLATGLGDDETGNVAITATEFAKTIKLAVKNNAAHTVYMTLLKARGTWYEDQTQITIKAEDTNSKTAYQKRTLSFDGKYMVDAAQMQTLCDYALAKYKDPTAELTMTIMNQNAATLTQILSREISDRITVMNDELGIAAIDIGSSAINRSGSFGATYTLIGLTNPVNVTGIITTIDIWAATSLTGMRVGTFYLVSGTTYKCRDSVTIGNVTAGSKQTFNTSLSVVTGDFIGCYFGTGSIEEEPLGSSGVMYLSGEHIDPDDEGTYSNAGYTTSGISLYGSGTDFFIDYMEHDISMSGKLHTATYRLATV